MDKSRGMMGEAVKMTLQMTMKMTPRTKEQVFRAGRSGTSKHLLLQEYAEKHPGRLTARLLKKMKGILAREEGISSKNWALAQV